MENLESQYYFPDTVSIIGKITFTERVEFFRELVSVDRSVYEKVKGSSIIYS